MIFHNGTANQTMALTSDLLSDNLDPASQTVTTITVPSFSFEHEVKTSEHIGHYLSGKSTAAISLKHWCQGQPWQAFKTEQSAFDMLVRWIASPIYATNSLSLSCAGTQYIAPNFAKSTRKAPHLATQQAGTQQAVTEEPTTALQFDLKSGPAPEAEKAELAEHRTRFESPNETVAN
jgi:hypothetical protein